MKKVLGLDISSSTIGWGMVSYDKEFELISYGHIKPPNKKKAGGVMQVRLNYAYDEIVKLINSECPDVVVIEDYVLRFSRGRSSANTIIVLATFNETVSLSLYREFGIIANRMSVREIRSATESLLGEKIKDKDDVLKLINKLFPTTFSEMINRNGRVKVETFDETDGIIAAIAFIMNSMKSQEKE